MQVTSSLVEDFGGFALDNSAVEMRSVSSIDIKLPYSGALPERMTPASSAYIYFNVQLARGANVVLAVETEVGEKLKRPLAASSEEILSLLDEFFKQTQEATGLDGYWLGIWQAHYIEWRSITKGPDLLLNILSTLSMRDRKFLQKRMMGENTAA